MSYLFPISEKMNETKLKKSELQSCYEVLCLDSRGVKFFSRQVIDGTYSKLNLKYNKSRVISDFNEQNDYILRQVSTIYPYLDMNDYLTKESMNGSIQLELEPDKTVWGKTILTKPYINISTDNGEKITPYIFEVFYWMGVLLYGVNGQVIYAPLPYRVLRSTLPGDEPEIYDTIFSNKDSSYTIDCNSFASLGMDSFLNFYGEKSPISILE